MNIHIFSNILWLLEDAKININELKDLNSKDIDEIFKYLFEQRKKGQVIIFCDYIILFCAIGALLSLFLINFCPYIFIAFFIGVILSYSIDAILRKMIKPFINGYTKEDLNEYKQFAKKNLKALNDFIKIYNSLPQKFNDNVLETQKRYYKKHLKSLTNNSKLDIIKM